MNEPKLTGVERFWEEAAYLAALTVHLIENKSDHETDAEIAEILTYKRFLMPIVFDALKAHGSHPVIFETPNPELIPKP